MPFMVLIGCHYLVPLDEIASIHTFVNALVLRGFAVIFDLLDYLSAVFELLLVGQNILHDMGKPLLLLAERALAQC